VHWNEDLYDSFEEAVKREEGIVIIAVFLKVNYNHVTYIGLLLVQMMKYF